MCLICSESKFLVLFATDGLQYWALRWLIVITTEQITLIPYKARTNHILNTLNIITNLKYIGFDILFVHFEQFIGTL